MQNKQNDIQKFSICFILIRYEVKIQRRFSVAGHFIFLSSSSLNFLMF